jgi:acyl-[acyl-carrier-protein]-phospholipid O-acyltransferase/long-chain-fatty-acid--[acyl-carrier-protein] ligase
LKEVWQDRRLRLSGVGVSFFWGFAGFINLAAIQIGSEMSGGGGQGFATENSWLMLAASGGIAGGGVVASLICKRKIELGLVPIGGLIMVVGSMALGLGPIERGWLMIWLAIAGGGGALLLVPLNAYLQDVCPPESRGKVLAGLNLLDCLSGLLAVVVQFAMAHWKVSYLGQFAALAAVSLMVTAYSARLLPQQFVRFVILSIFRSVYKVKVMHRERMPKSGGVLLISNHISFIDAFILSTASSRPLQFLLFDEYFEHRWVGRVARFFDAIPISKSRAKDGVKVAVEALKQGHVVCIFPEGQLTRTGAMNEWMNGFKIIARRAKCPVLPVAMDGVWGSIFSFERNRFLSKKPYSVPYGVRVNFGSLISPREVDTVLVRRQVECLRAEALADRALLKKPSKVTGRNVTVLAGDRETYQSRVDAVRRLSETEQRDLLFNAVQIGEINAIQRGQTVMFEWDALAHCQDVIGVVFAQYFGLRVIVVGASASVSDVVELVKAHQVDQLVGGALFAEVARKSDQNVGCYDFSKEAVARMSRDDEDVEFPCLAVEGRVVAMSMPNPPKQTEINDLQLGHRVGTLGYVLPGFEVVCDESGVTLAGALSAPIHIPGASVDGDGMLRM